MKRISMLALAALIGGAATAQDAYDAANFAGSDLNGTARYVGMGGALSALGGDISTMGTNPAGTAIFHRSEAALSASAVITGEKGQLGHDGTRASFDQAGLVFVLGNGNRTGKGLQNINFGFNYNKKRNHLSNLDVNVENLGGIFSQTFQIADLANASAEYNYWGGMLADMSASSKDHDGILNENTVTGTDGTEYTEYSGQGANSAIYRRAAYGSTTQADFNMSFNLSNQFFLGFSLGVYDVNYNREAWYMEEGSDGNYYDFSNWYETNGEGFDVKIGAIIRPIADSPFRIGLAVHTPTWYNLEDVNGSTLYYNDNFIAQNSTDPYEYHYRTPWKFDVSLGHTVGNFLAIGAEYEFSDLSTCHYSSIDYENDAYFAAMNDYIGETLRCQHTLKLGIEVKPTSAFSLRAGYNYVSAPFRDDAFRTIAYDSPFTETDFTNWKAINRITLGAGYRWKSGYFDIAYQYQAQKGDFYAFDDVNLEPTEIDNNRSQILATLGFRF